MLNLPMVTTQTVPLLQIFRLRQMFPLKQTLREKLLLVFHPFHPAGHPPPQQHLTPRSV